MWKVYLHLDCDKGVFPTNTNVQLHIFENKNNNLIFSAKIPLKILSNKQYYPLLCLNSHLKLFVRKFQNFYYHIFEIITSSEHVY